MTITTNTPAGGTPDHPPEDLVTVTIDGMQIKVPKGTLLIRAAEQLGIEIPRFCDHPLLDPVGACRQCLVDIPDAGNGRAMPKPQASCTITVMDGMVVNTQNTSKVAEKAQRGMMEFLLINHPLDCPTCDKGGECPLQNQAMSTGQGETRFEDVKRTFEKPVALSTEVLLDRERCIQCARCTRFSEQIAGDPFIELLERGAEEQVGIAEGEPFQSYFSGNTVQICPVGALTGAAYRFRARPFDQVSTPTTCEHCASGCAMRTDHRRGKVTRRLAGDDPEVNEEWNCDKGRWAFTYATRKDRLTRPCVRNDDGRLEHASWPDAIATAARGLAAARDQGPGKVAVLAGGRLTIEDAYAYAKFARIALNSNDIDMRARPHSGEEAQFLASRVAGRGIEVSYTDIERAPAVLLAGFEPEDESPMVFLRLRKAMRKHGQKVFSVGTHTTPGLRKAGGTLLATMPGAEAGTLDALAAPKAHAPDEAAAAAGAAMAEPGAVILVGERLAESPGALSAAVRLAEATGASLAWVPRRAGERGAVEAGALPHLLPGGRPVRDAGARDEVARRWSTARLPSEPGRDTAAILAAAEAGELAALVVAGVDLDDLPDPERARAALARVPLIVSLELRASNVTDRADVVFPVAAAAEKSGTFLDWEGRPRPFEAALDRLDQLTDLRVLTGLADRMDVHLGLPDGDAALRELDLLGSWTGPRPKAPTEAPTPPSEPAPGQARLATWAELLDAGRMQDGEPFLAGTARRPVARISAGTAGDVGVSEGDLLYVGTPVGSICLPVALTEMPDRAVWLPTNAEGCGVRSELAACTGTLVTLSGGPA